VSVGRGSQQPHGTQLVVPNVQTHRQSYITKENLTMKEKVKPFDAVDIDRRCLFAK
jgi:hypothetical protein